MGDLVTGDSAPTFRSRADWCAYIDGLTADTWPDWLPRLLFRSQLEQVKDVLKYGTVPEHVVMLQPAKLEDPETGTWRDGAVLCHDCRDRVAWVTARHVLDGAHLRRGDVTLVYGSDKGRAGQPSWVAILDTLPPQRDPRREQTLPTWCRRHGRLDIPVNRLRLAAAKHRQAIQRYEHLLWAAHLKNRTDPDWLAGQLRAWGLPHDPSELPDDPAEVPLPAPTVVVEATIPPASGTIG